MISSFRVDNDVLSLDGRDPLQTEAEVGDDGKSHVTVRKSTSSRYEIVSRMSHGPRSGVYLTPRPSSFNHNDIYSVMDVKNASNASPRQSNYGNLGFVEESGAWGYGSHTKGNVGYSASSSAGIYSPVAGPGAKKKANGADVCIQNCH